MLARVPRSTSRSSELPPNVSGPEAEAAAGGLRAGPRRASRRGFPRSQAGPQPALGAAPGGGPQVALVARTGPAGRRPYPVD